jgi:DNA-directed RNA polymerase specialized sigma24 family protein
MDQFRELYERYYADVYRFALFLTGDVARAEDLTADTFVRDGSRAHSTLVNSQRPTTNPQNPNSQTV